MDFLQRERDLVKTGITMDNMCLWFLAYVGLCIDKDLAVSNDQFDTNVFQRFLRKYPSSVAMPVFQASGYRVNGPVNSETVIDGIAICLRLFIPDFRLLEANQKAYLQKLDVLTELIDNRFHPSNVGRFRDWGY